MARSTPQDHFETLFEHAPISLWEEDYSGIRRLFDRLRRQGVESLDEYLQAHPGFGEECIRWMKVLRVNRRTLSLLKAGSQEQLVASLNQVFRDGMRHHFRSELLALWNGDLEWSGQGINTTLEGEPLDILLHWRILPGSERSWKSVLVTLEDVTARVRAERRLQNLFEAAPISLWEEDLSALKAQFDLLRSQGVTDLASHLREHPEAVTDFMRRLKVLDVNQKTLELFGAESKQQLLASLGRIFRDEMKTYFARELVDLWNGRTTYERDGINYSLTGDPLDVHLDFRLMPGHEQDFSWVLVALQDITARKKAEEYLRYLGTHDVLTGLYNRLFFEETLQRMEAERRDPVSILLSDLNGLKRINDSHGHQAGDNFIRRAAEVFKAAFPEPAVAARIGGDEFAAFLPGAGEEQAAEAIEHLRVLIGMNNQYYRQPELSMSIGTATSRPGLSLEKVVGLADDAMYRDKGAHYRRRREDH